MQPNQICLFPGNDPGIFYLLGKYVKYVKATLYVKTNPSVKARMQGKLLRLREKLQMIETKQKNTRIHDFDENNLCDDHVGCDLLSIS